jgi:hypothetical protein
LAMARFSSLTSPKLSEFEQVRLALTPSNSKNDFRRHKAGHLCSLLQAAG